MDKVLFEEIVSAIDSPLYVADKVGTLLYVNPAFEKVTGYTAREIVGERTSILKSGRMPNSYYENLWNAILNGKPWKEEIINRRKDGSDYTALQYISPVFDNEGDILFFTAVQYDITREKELRNEREIFFDVSVDLFFIADRSGFFTQTSSAWEALLGWQGDELAGKSVHEFIHPEDDGPFTSILEEIAASGDIATVDTRMTAKDDTPRWVSWRMYFNRDKNLFYASGRDIQERVEMEEEIRRISVTDPLTGVYNRLKFDEELKKEIARAERYDSPLALMLFDIDFFKNVNDTFGHNRGDEVLKEVVRLVQKQVRDIDTFARWGGEEFVLLCPYTKKEDALALSERIRRSIETNRFEEVETITVSVGVGLFKPEHDTKKTLLLRIDAALYEAKDRGRNRVQLAV